MAYEAMTSLTVKTPKGLVSFDPGQVFQAKPTSALEGLIKAGKVRAVKKPEPAFCSWLKAEVEQCLLPCHVWDRDKGNTHVCPHFQQYMKSIGRWT